MWNNVIVSHSEWSLNLHLALFFRCVWSFWRWLTLRFDSNETLAQGRNHKSMFQGCLLPSLFLIFSFLFPSFPSVSPLFPCIETAPHPAEGFKRSLLASPQRRRTTFAATRHVLWALNAPKMRLRARTGNKRIFCIESPGNLSSCCKCRSIPFRPKANLKIEANVAVSKCTVFLHFISGVLHPTSKKTCAVWLASGVLQVIHGTNQPYVVFTQQPQQQQPCCSHLQTTCTPSTSCCDTGKHPFHHPRVWETGSGSFEVAFVSFFRIPRNYTFWSSPPRCVTNKY